MVEASQTPGDARRKNVLPELNGLRAFACIWVVLHHCVREASTGAPLLDHCIDRGSYGVPIFFMLSGFLLTLPFASAAGGPVTVSLATYAVRRLARIAPAYYLCLFCTLFWLEGAGGDTWLRLAASLGFVNSYFPATFFPSAANPPLWSIGVEVQFYLLLPVVLVGLARCGQVTWGRLLATCLALQVVACVAVAWPLSRLNAESASPTAAWAAMMNPLVLFPQFLFGGVLAYVHCRAEGLTSRLAKVPAWLADLVVSLAFLGILTVDWSRALPGAGAAFDFAVLSYQFPLFHLLLVPIFLLTRRTTLWKAVLGNGLAKWGADLSFGVYLWHFPIMHVVAGRHPGGGFASLAATTLAVSFVFAAASYMVMERPILRAGHAWTRGGYQRLGSRSPAHS